MLNGIMGKSPAGQYLKSVIEKDLAASAYIIAGDKDSGQELLAYEAAYALLCESKNKPCGRCAACRAAASGNNMNLITVSAEVLGKQSIGVEDIRERIADTVMIKPFAADKKVYLILDADDMTVQAQNSLLKTIEEPPLYAYFILTTSNDRQVLPTVHSRCVRLEVGELSTEDIREALRIKGGLSDGEIDRAAAFAFGKLQRAYRYADEPELSEVFTRLPLLMKALCVGHIDEINENINAFLESKTDMGEILDLIKLWLRDALVYKHTGSKADMLMKNFADEVAAFADGFSLKVLCELAEEPEHSHARLRARVGNDLIVELLREKIREGYHLT